MALLGININLELNKLIAPLLEEVTILRFIFWLGLVFIVAVIASIIITEFKTKDWEGYRMDEFKGIVWRWNYNNKNLEKLNDIIYTSDLKPYCLADDMRLKVKETVDGFELTCQKCDKKLDFKQSRFDFKKDIIREIERKIRSEEYKNSDYYNNEN